MSESNLILILQVILEALFFFVIRHVRAILPYLRHLTLPATRKIGFLSRPISIKVRSLI